MKIYESTEYIEPKDVCVGNLKLKVNSMWDFSSRDICSEVIYRGQSNQQTISYNLLKCVEVKNQTFTKWEDAEITDEIKEEIINKGYVLSNEYKIKEKLNIEIK